MARCQTKYTTLLDLARQAKIISGNTACFDGKIQAGIPFSGYPTGVDLSTVVNLGIVSQQDAVLSGSSATTIFDVSNSLSPNYDPIFEPYSGDTWTNPLFSAHTVDLTLPITILSATTQEVGPIWTLTQTGMTGDHEIGLEYTGYTIQYSFFNIVDIGSVTPLYTGFTTAQEIMYSAGTLDYKGPLDYLRSREDATVDNRLTTKKLRVTGGASASTIGYVLTQVDEIGSAEWVFNSASATTNTFVTSGLLNGSDQLELTYNTGGSVPPIDLSALSGDSWNLQSVLEEGSNPPGFPPFSSNDSVGILSGNSVVIGTGDPLGSPPLTATTLLWLNQTKGTVQIAAHHMVSDVDEGAVLINAENIYGESTIEVSGGEIGINTTGSTILLEADGNILVDGLGELTNPSVGDVLSAKDSAGRLKWVTPFSITGITSGDCITDLYVSNIHSCSPLNINPLDEGNIYFGSDSGVTIDLGSDKKVGIGTITPIEKLNVEGGNILALHDQDTTSFVAIKNFNTGEDARASLHAVVRGEDGIDSSGIFAMFGSGYTGNAGFAGEYLPNSLSIATAGGADAQRAHVNIGSRRTDGEIRFFTGDEDYDNGSLLGIWNSAGLTLSGSSHTFKLNTNTLQVRDSAVTGYVLTAIDGDGNAQWQESTGGGTFTGNTSGDCINALWVSNISGCTGDLHIGASSGDIIFDYNGDTSTPNLFIKSDGLIGVGTNDPFSGTWNGTPAGIEIQMPALNDNIALAFSETGSRRFYFVTDFATAYEPVHIYGGPGPSTTPLLTFYTNDSGGVGGGRIGMGTVQPQGSLQISLRGDVANQTKYPDETNIVINNTSTGWTGATSETPNSSAFRFDHLSSEKPGGLITSVRQQEWESGIYSTNLELWNASGGTLEKRIEIEAGWNTNIFGDVNINYGGTFYTDLNNDVGPNMRITGGSDDLVAIYTTIPNAEGMSIGSRGATEPSFPGYGKNSDGFIYSSAQQNGLNIISTNGAGTEDYIRFYAGTNATLDTAMIILGTGATQGFIGMGTDSPTEKLHVEGSVRIVDGNEQNGYVLTSNANGVGSWQPSTGGGGTFTGNTSGDCITDLWVSNIHSCSPLNINPEDEGNVYYGSTSGVTIDVINSRIGIGTDDPDFPLHVVSTNQVEVKIESSTNNAFLTLSSSNGTNSYIDYEDGSGDRWIVGAHGGDNEKFKWATGTTFGSDTVMTLTKEGELGIGTTTPDANLHIEGNIKIVDGTEQNGYVLTSDANGLGSWQASTSGDMQSVYDASNPDVTATDNTKLLDLTNGEVSIAATTAGGGTGQITIATSGLGLGNLSMNPNGGALSLGTVSLTAGDEATVASQQSTFIFAGNDDVRLAAGNTSRGTSNYSNKPAGINIEGGGLGVEVGVVDISAWDATPGGTTDSRIILDGANGSIRISGTDLGTPVIGDVLSAKNISGDLEWSTPSGSSCCTLQDTFNQGTVLEPWMVGIFTPESVIANLSADTVFIGTGWSGTTPSEYNNIALIGDETTTGFPGRQIQLQAKVDGTGDQDSGRIQLKSDHGGLLSEIRLKQGDIYLSGTNLGTPSTGDILRATSVNGTIEWADPSSLPSSPFTGNTSGTCIDVLWVSTISGCSPVTIGSSVQSENSTATGTNSFAYGESTTASGDDSHAEGSNTIASNTGAHAEGGFWGEGGGIGTLASGISSHAEGAGTVASGDACHAEGFSTTASTGTSHAEGSNTHASGSASHAEGDSSIASEARSHAEGWGTEASGIASHAEGRASVASGFTSHAEGSYTVAGNFGSHAEGAESKAYGVASHAEGADTQAIGGQSHSEGQGTIASGDNSHAEGFGSEGSASASHAEGFSTEASGDYSHSEGFSTIASGSSAHAQGRFTIAGGEGSHAGGYGYGTGIEILSTGLSSFAHFHLGETSVSSGVEGDYSAILGGRDHSIGVDNTDSIIIGGQWNGITGHSGTYNSIMGGIRNVIGNHGGVGTEPVNKSVIIGGQINGIECTGGDATDNAIISSFSSIMSLRNAQGHVIIGGNDHEMTLSNKEGNAIIGGTSHSISGDNSAIIGGDNNSIGAAFSNTVIIGGSNITATSADTVFMPNVDLCEFGGILTVSNVESCSPLHINTRNQGNVHIGDQGGAPIVTIDITTPNEPGMYFGEESFIRWKENEQKLIIGEEEAGGKVVIEVEGDEILDVEKERTVVREGDLETEDGNIIVKSGNSKTVIIEDIPDVSGANLGTNIDGELIDIPSDSRVKFNVEEIPNVVDALEFISRVKGYEFQWRPETRIGDPNKKHYGFKVDDFRDDLINSTGQNLSADQKAVNEVGKNMVKRTKRKFMFGNNSQPEHVDKMNYEDLIPFMIEGIKSLNVNMTNLSSVSSGGAKKYVNVHTLSKGNTETITHNLDEEDVIVQLLSESGEMVIPERVSNYLPNSVDIDVSVTSNYKIIIMG